MDSRHSRFSDAPWYSIEQITIGGAGSIGSWLSLFLTRIGHKLYIYDFDNVEIVNVAGQTYGPNDVNVSKVSALSGFIFRTCGDNGNVYYNLKIESDTILNPISISCFDNMKSREVMFNRWIEIVSYLKGKGNDISKAIFIDGRLEAENGEVFFVKFNDNDIKRYRETLFEDNSIPDLPCSFKSTTHSAAMIASYMNSGLNNFLSNINTGFDMREVPFRIKYMLPMFMVDINIYNEENVVL